MGDSRIFYDKELSWLSFNERVLQEAQDSSVPLIERLRFLGIYASNLDEFFRVRVAALKRNAIFESAQQQSTTAKELRASVLDKVKSLTRDFEATVQQVTEALKKQHVHILISNDVDVIAASTLTPNQEKWLDNYFDDRILRHLTPVILNNETPLEDCLEADSIYFLVALKTQNNIQYALVEIPRQETTRFIRLPNAGSKKEKYMVLLDDVIEHYMGKLFAQFFTFEEIYAYSLKLTRDAEYSLGNEIDHSLLDNLSKGLKQRLKSDPVSLIYDHRMPMDMQKYLKKKLNIKHFDSMIPGIKYRAFKDFSGFPNIGRKSLEKTKLHALSSELFNAHPTVFSAISEQDILLHYPYHKFRHFTEFVRQAAYDPAVVKIELNIYRVAKNSRIIHSLTEAVKNGKNVTVVVELRARFDEQANIEWARFMTDAGIKVEFGIESLKIHSKLCLVTRIEDGKAVRYAHLGTGNFHESTAKVYTDFSLFTKHREITQEVSNVFSFIEHSYKRFRFNHLIVSPLNSRRRIYQLIENEIASAQVVGNKGQITLKVNNLVDDGLIQKLYEASNKGVKVRIIVRGMCALRPGLSGISENISVISIVDQFLEHPRVMIFHNGGDHNIYISSADWMTRNIDERVEVGCPIYDAEIKKRILNIIELHFKDTTKARIIDQDQTNQYVKRGNRKKIRSQLAIYDYLQADEEKNLRLVKKDIVKQDTDKKDKEKAIES